MAFDNEGNWVASNSVSKLRQERQWNTPGAAPTPNHPTGLAATWNTFKKDNGFNYTTDAGFETGGIGSYGTFKDSNGNLVGMDQDAFNAANINGTEGLTKTGGTGGVGLADGLALGTKALGAIGGIMDARLGKKKLKLAEEQFGFQKAAANRDVANQAQLVNNQIQNAGEVGMGLAGNTMDTAARAARQAQMNTMKVNGSPIG